MFGCMHNLKQW